MSLEMIRRMLSWPLMLGIGVTAYQTCSVPPLEKEVPLEDEVTNCPLPKLEILAEHDCLYDRQCVFYDKLKE